MKSILDLNTKLVEQFFSFMFLRAKKSLETINNESITSAVFGNLEHSELLRIQTIIKVNPLQIIGEKYCFYPLVNLSDCSFINNSIGFAIMISKNKEISIIIPLNEKIAIFISNNSELRAYEFLYIESEGAEKVDEINTSISIMEKEYGNGFIFGSSKELIEKYKDFLNGDNDK